MSFTQRKKDLQVTTYSKVVALLTIVSIGFLLIFAFLYYNSKTQHDVMTKVSTQQFENEANALVKLNSEGYTTLINEITYWDELVRFIEKKDLNWFNNSLSYLVDTNKIDYIDAYDINGNFINKIST